MQKKKNQKVYTYFSGRSQQEVILYLQWCDVIIWMLRLPDKTRQSEF